MLSLPGRGPKGVLSIPEACRGPRRGWPADHPCDGGVPAPRLPSRIPEDLAPLPPMSLVSADAITSCIVGRRPGYPPDSADIANPRAEGGGVPGRVNRPNPQAKGLPVKIGQPGSFRREAAPYQARDLFSHAGTKGKESGPVMDLTPAIVSPLRDAPSRFRRGWTVTSSLGCGSVNGELSLAGIRLRERRHDLPSVGRPVQCARARKFFYRTG